MSNYYGVPIRIQRVFRSIIWPHYFNLYNSTNRIWIKLRCIRGNFAVLKEDGESLNAHSFQLVEVCLYFSAVTLLSVGYGDISPIGIGRWIAIAEALIGYTLPFAFVMRSVIDNEK